MKKILKKIGKSWKENRVLFVLTTILIVCLVLIICVLISYFLGSSKDKYGDRLDGIKKVQITDKKEKELEKKVMEDDKVSKCDINPKGKTIYVDINFNSGVSLDEAKALAESTLEMFSEKELKFYDISYTLIEDKKEASEENEGNAGFTIMGARNSNGTGLIWNNNTPFVDEIEE